MRLSTSTTLLAGTVALLGAVAVAASALTAPPALAQSAEAGAASTMTEAERAAFREEVRRFLLEEPEIVAEALRELERQRTRDALTGLEATIDQGDYVQKIAPAGADLMLIELTDYDCPYCRRAQPEVAEFLKNDPKVGHVVVALPYIGADTAERAALAAKLQSDDATVSKLHMTLMSQEGRMTEASLRAVVDDLDLDWDRLLVDMASPTVEGQLGRTLEIARALRIEGTPAFVIGGRVLGGLRSAEELASIAAEIRAEQAKN